MPGPDLKVVATNPTAEMTGAPRDAPIRVRFDRFLDPTTVVRQSVRVTGGTVDAAGNAVAGEEFLEPFYDALERVVVYRLSEGRFWAPGNRYTITLFRPGERENGGFRAWDGAPLGASFSFSFTTSAEEPPVRTEPLPSKVTYCSDCALFPATNADGSPYLRPDGSQGQIGHEILGGSVTLRCAGGVCHGTDLPGGPAQALDLSAFPKIKATAIGKVAHQTLTGPTHTAETNPTRFGASMPLIDPGQPGNSYVMYKILIDPKLWDRAGTASPTNLPAQNVGGELRPPAEEIERLNQAFVLGSPMPLGFSLTLPQARALQAWIASGAEGSDACPDVSACTSRNDPETDKASGGAGGSAGSGGAGGSSGASGQGGAAGSGGSTFTPKEIVGCTLATAVATSTIAFKGFSYDPPCARVKVGTEITVPASTLHPLSGMVKAGDQPNFIPQGNFTADQKYTPSTPGTFAYFCTAHGADDPTKDGSGMAGVIYVTPD